MKKKWMALLAAVLAVAMLLTGCTAVGLMEQLQSILQLGLLTSYEDMEYTRPDMDTFRLELEKTMQAVESEEDAAALMESVYTMYGLYYSFCTNYSLANIRYCTDMTDIYWNEEYGYCLEYSSDISAGMDRMLYALADCPLREELEGEEYFGEGFFDWYDGDSLWDETFTALMEEESGLLDQYYELSALSAEAEYYSEEFFSGYGEKLEEVYVQLVRLRQEIAAYAGYESYPEFAYDFYFYRDYTPDQAMEYAGQIREELVELYTGLDTGVWSAAMTYCDEESTFDYVRQCAAALGGTAEYAFRLLERGSLYDISYSENKYSASFEVFLFDYYTPFIFVSPGMTQDDKLTFVHEFGHFCSDYAAGGSIAGVDVAEVFSQGLEYLSLSYCTETEALTALKMADSLCVFVEQAAYAALEHQVYGLEEVTVESVRELTGQVYSDFGLTAYGRDCRDYVLIPHLFISPMYVISYVVSCDAAMQIYALEQETAGAGAEVWEDNLATEEMYFLAFLEQAGLQSPFREGGVEELKAIFTAALG